MDGLIRIGKAEHWPGCLVWKYGDVFKVFLRFNSNYLLCLLLYMRIKSPFQIWKQNIFISNHSSSSTKTKSYSAFLEKLQNRPCSQFRKNWVLLIAMCDCLLSIHFFAAAERMKSLSILCSAIEINGCKFLKVLVHLYKYVSFHMLKWNSFSVYREKILKIHW